MFVDALFMQLLCRCATKMLSLRKLFIFPIISLNVFVLSVLPIEIRIAWHGLWKSFGIRNKLLLLFYYL